MADKDFPPPLPLLSLRAATTFPGAMPGDQNNRNDGNNNAPRLVSRQRLIEIIEEVLRIIQDDDFQDDDFLSLQDDTHDDETRGGHDDSNKNN